MHVLDTHLASHEYLAGDTYTIADMAVFPWYGAMAKGLLYGAAEFLAVHEYTHVLRWADQINQRPAVIRGRKVNVGWGEPANQLLERHDASDFELRTQDKIGG
jgi:GST-like protein